MKASLKRAGIGAAGLLTAALASGPALAQTTAPTAYAPPAAAPAGPCCRVPEGAEVAVELLHPIDTRDAKTGDLVPIRLAAPLIVDGQVILPAGTPGVGRVVQSSGPGIGGKGAKLVVAAEYLNVPGGGVKLAGMQLTGTGKDQSKAAGLLGLGGIAFMPLGIIGTVMTGGHIQIPAGTAAAAKIGEPVVLPPVAPAEAEDYRRVQAVFGPSQASRGWIETPPPPPGMGQVVFFRPKSVLNIQWFNVREEGEALGKLTNGAYFVVPLRPGDHSFTASSEPTLKDRLNLKIDEGETYYVEATMTKGLVLGAAQLVPSEKARFDEVSGDLQPAETETAENRR